MKYLVPSYYFHNLSPREQQGYLRLVESVRLHRRETMLSGLELTEESVYRVFYSLCLDHPEIIWLAPKVQFWQEQVQRPGCPPVKQVVKMGCTYTMDRTQVKEKMIEIERASAVLIAGMTRGHRTPWEQVLWLHDALIHGTDYDMGEKNDHRIRADNHSIYGVLVKRVAVCEGYAETMTYLLRQVGIPCITCMGAKGWAANVPPDTALGSAHAWNCITIDGHSMQLDTTWDDLGNTKGERGITYRYFGLTQGEMEQVHGHGSYLTIPVCNSPGMNYFVHNGLVAQNLEEVKRLVKRAVERKQSFLEFRVKNPAILRQLEEKDRHNNPIWFPTHCRTVGSYRRYEPDRRIGWVRVEFDYR